MGLFDIFKKKEKVLEQVENTSQEQCINMPAFRTTSDGRLQAEYYNGETTQKEFYDTTKLTIDTKHTMNLAGQLLYNCVVAWDSIDDCVMIDEKRMRRAEIAGNREDYKGIWLDLDLERLQTDSIYCDVLMNRLLLKSRVSKIIEDGLKETPDRPCGKYVGGVIEEEGIYKKYFDRAVGNAAHQTTFMKDRREKLREKEREKKAAIIEANKRKIEELMAENESLEK